jgi:Stress responsive A/B Barrel Domain
MPAALAASLSAENAPRVEPAAACAYSRAMMRHVFLWNVNPDAGPDAAQRIVDAVNRLKDEPVAALAWAIGRDAPAPGSEASGGRWEYALVCDYRDQAHLEEYYKSPEHDVVTAEVVPLIADRAVVDYEF